MAKSFMHLYDKQMSPQRPRASGGGDMRSGNQACRDVMNYQEPVIPGWSPYGSMSPGLGGANLTNCGTQGPKSVATSTGDGAGGGVGIKKSGGEGQGMGTNRKG